MLVHASTVSGSVLIVHEQPFVSHALETLLINNDFDVLGNIDDLDSLDSANIRGDPDLCIVGYFEEPGKFELACQIVQRRFPSCRLLMIDARYSSRAMKAAKANKLSAYLSFHLTPDLILNGIRLVYAGSECFPTGADYLGGVPKFCSRDDSTTSFTQRETDVLNLIVAGLSNKMIARKLSISESTVKGYMNAVLRKTDTNNRTQAACWAVEHGYGLESEEI